MPEDAPEISLVRRAGRTFWSVLGFLAVIATLYWGALSVGWTQGFWIVVSTAALVTLVVVGGPYALTSAERVRDYPKLLAAAAKDRDQVSELRLALQASKAKAASAYQDGVQEGRRQVEGTVLSLSSDPPEVVGIAEYDGSVAILGRLTDPAIPEGARFTVEAKHTGQVKGVVEAAQTDVKRSVVYFKCVDPRVPRFWELLAARVEHEPGPPDGMVLGRYSYSTGGAPAQTQGVTDSDRERPDELQTEDK